MPSSKSRSNLAQRVVTAVAIAVILLPAFLLLPKTVGYALVTAFVLGAAWEWAAFLPDLAAAGRLIYVGVIAAAMVLVEWLVPERLALSGFLALTIGWWAIAFALVLRFPLQFNKATVAGAGVLVLVPAWLAMVVLLATAENGRSLLLAAIATTSAADIGAYFAGRRLGRVKLAPGVSPGKTWEGAIGGLVLAAAVAAATAAWLGFPLLPALYLGIGVGVISVVGDLTASMFKRSAGLKDSGSLFPGHGGILDRVDSMTAAAPLFVLIAGWLGWLGH